MVLLLFPCTPAVLWFSCCSFVPLLFYGSPAVPLYPCCSMVLLLFLCTPVVLWFSCCSLVPLLFYGSPAVPLYPCCSMVLLLFLCTPVVLWFSCCSLVPLLFYGSPAVPWYPWCSMVLLLFPSEHQLWHELITFCEKTRTFSIFLYISFRNYAEVWSVEVQLYEDVELRSFRQMWPWGPLTLWGTILFHRPPPVFSLWRNAAAEKSCWGVQT